jgi:hypothetical protein
MNENTQRIEILTVRDPDESTVVRMFIDGVEVEGYAEVSVDPGAGHMLSDWRASQAEILAGDYSEGFKTAALAAYEEEEGSEYVTPDEGIALFCYALVAGPFNYCDWRYEGPDDIEAAAAAYREHRTTHDRQA